MKWAAIVLFASPQLCDAFSEEHNLQAAFDQQCILVETGDLAPATSPRPMPKPERNPEPDQ